MRPPTTRKLGVACTIKFVCGVILNVRNPSAIESNCTEDQKTEKDDRGIMMLLCVSLSLNRCEFMRKAFLNLCTHLGVPVEPKLQKTHCSSKKYIIYMLVSCIYRVDWTGLDWTGLSLTKNVHSAIKVSVVWTICRL